MIRALSAVLVIFSLACGQAFVNQRPIEDGAVVYRSEGKARAEASLQLPPAPPPPPPSTPVPPSRAPEVSGRLELPPGRLFEAVLITGVMAPLGGETPVLAESTRWCEDPPCRPLYLLGTARLHETGRAAVQFTEVVLDGQVVKGNFVAFDPHDKLYAVKGQVMDVAPSLALDLVRAAVGGVADWVQATLNAKTVVITDQGVVQESTVPEAWTFPLAAMAKTVKPQESATTLIRAVVVDAGAPLLVLSLPGETGFGVERVRRPVPEAQFPAAGGGPQDVLNRFLKQASGK